MAAKRPSSCLPAAVCSIGAIGMRRSFRDYNELANAALRPLDLPMPEIDVGSISAGPIAPRRVTTPPADKAHASVHGKWVRVSIGRSPRAARSIEPTAGEPPPVRPTPVPPLR